MDILEESTMKSLFEQFDGTYRKENDYLIPNLEMPDAENFEIGIYGQQYLYFLQHYRRITYINLITSGRHNEYLAKIDKQVQKRFELLVTQMKETQGISERLKADSPMEWVRKMNCIRCQEDEIILNELIYQ